MNIFKIICESYFKFRHDIPQSCSMSDHKNIILSKNILIRKNCTFVPKRQTEVSTITINENSSIKENTYILAGGGTVSLGKNFSGGSKLTLLGGGGITIGNDVSISHNVGISSSSHDYNDINVLSSNTIHTFQLVQIHDNVVIGMNSTILMGCTIEQGAIIGAGSVVTQGTVIKAFEVWAGNPAKKLYDRTSLEEKIEIEITNYLINHPFHNIFQLHDISHVFASKFGGTCSDRSTQFKRILENKFHNTPLLIQLHRAYIKGKKTHTILRISIHEKVYFIDVGMGYPITKLIPLDTNIEFSSYGMDFETQCSSKLITVFIDENEGKGKVELMTIDANDQNQEEIESEINNRFKNSNHLPFSKSFRYYFIDDGKFYKLEGLKNIKI